MIGSKEPMSPAPKFEVHANHDGLIPLKRRFVSLPRTRSWSSMKKVEFTKEQKTAIARRVQRYFVEQLDAEICTVSAIFLVDFFAYEIGGHFYNRGLIDAHEAMSARLDDVFDEVWKLEMATGQVQHHNA